MLIDVNKKEMQLIKATPPKTKKTNYQSLHLFTKQTLSSHCSSPHLLLLSHS